VSHCEQNALHRDGARRGEGFAETGGRTRPAMRFALSGPTDEKPCSAGRTVSPVGPARHPQRPKVRQGEDVAGRGGAGGVGPHHGFAWGHGSVRPRGRVTAIDPDPERRESARFDGRDRCCGPRRLRLTWPVMTWRWNAFGRPETSAGMPGGPSVPRGRNRHLRRMRRGRRRSSRSPPCSRELYDPLLRLCLHTERVSAEVDNRFQHRRNRPDRDDRTPRARASNQNSPKPFDLVRDTAGVWAGSLVTPT